MVLSHFLCCAALTPQRFALRRGRKHVIGRDPVCEVHLPSDLVSRRHAEVEWALEGAFKIRDLGSANGTRVNDVPVLKSLALRPGDVISIGQFEMEYRQEEERAASKDSRDSKDGRDGRPRKDSSETTPLKAQGAGMPSKVDKFGAFNGSFSGHELLEVCRLLGLGEKDGVLTIQGEDLSGQLAFESGVIRVALAHARDQKMKELKGDQAAHALLELPRGHFEFAVACVARERNCTIKPAALTMEAARRLDERSSEPATPTSSTGASDLLDASPEYDPRNSTQRFKKPG